MILELSKRIGRPPAEVFRFVAIDHVRNHPRWDPFMELEQVSQGTIGVGTVIRRRQTHTGSPVEGTMEVTEFELDRVIGLVIKDGPVQPIRSPASATASSCASQGETTALA